MRSHAFSVRRPWLGLAALVTAVALVTVAAQACGESEAPSIVRCERDMTVEQGESCMVSGSETMFVVADTGMGCIGVRTDEQESILFGLSRLFGLLEINMIVGNNATCREGSEGSVVENGSVAAIKNADGSWTIRELY